MTLSQRIQTAQPDETRALLEEAYNAIHGKSCDWVLWYGEIEQKHEARAFQALLDINTQEAFLAAAMMLVDEDMREMTMSTVYGVAHVGINMNHGPNDGPYYGSDDCGSLPLALLSAICMARGL